MFARIKNVIHGIKLEFDKTTLCGKDTTNALIYKEEVLSFPARADIWQCGNCFFPEINMKGSAKSFDKDEVCSCGHINQKNGLEFYPSMGALHNLYVHKGVCKNRKCKHCYPSF